MEKIGEFTDIDYEELDRALQEQIGSQIKELEGLKIENKKIGNPEKLVESISQIVWEQFMLQLAGQAGQDFITQNNNLNLSLKKADHILTETSFINKEFPVHNTAKMDEYQKRYDSYYSNFAKDDNGNVKTHQTRMGTKENTLAKGARDKFDVGRPSGSKENNTAMDHTVSAAEMMRDKKAGAFLNEDEKISFANSDDNLNEINSSWNSSKKDKTTTEWLDNPNSKGQNPRDIFDMTDEDELKLRNKDVEARKKWEELKEEGEKRAIDEGNASRRAEALKSAGITTQAIMVALLAKLTRTIFQELIRWLGEKNRKAKTFIEHLKKAINDFFWDFKNNVMLSIDIGVTVILTQLFGEIIPMIRKAMLFIKVGGQNLFEVVKYLKNPENKNKDTSEMIMDIGKIVTIGLTTAGGIGLGMVITGMLEYYAPPLAISIPLLGSPASLLGIFFGGITAGICGAIVLNSIDGALAGKMLSENVSNQLIVQNGILVLQNSQFELYESKVDDASTRAANSIKDNMLVAIETMENIKKTIDENRTSQNENKFNDISSMLDDFE